MKKVLIVAFPPVLLLLATFANAETRLVFPRVSVGENRFTGIAVMNPSASAAEITFRAFRPDGTLVSGAGIVNPAVRSLGAGRQLSVLAGELFKLPDAQPGTSSARFWVEAVSSQSGLTGFFLEGAASLTSLAGSDIAGMGTDLLLPLIDNSGGSITELSIVNPNEGAAELAVEFLRPAGTIAATSDITIPSMGAFQGALSGAFSAPWGEVVSARIRADRPLSVFGYVTREGVYSTIAVPAVSVALSSNLLCFPDFVQGEGWSSTVGLVNLKPEPVLVSVTALRPDGSLMTAPSLTENPVTRTIPPSGSIRLDLANAFGFSTSMKNAGWLKVEAGQEAIHGYLESGIGSARTLSLAQLEAFSRSIFSHQAVTSPFFTSLAVLNPGNITTNLEVFSLASDGSVAGRSQFVLRPGRRESLRLQEWVPGAQPTSGGAVFLKTDAPVIASQLFGTENLSAIAAIPPQKLPSTFTVTSAAPVALVPPLAVVETGKSQKFNVTGAANPAWLVNGIPGGNSSTGTLTAAGLYTAPRTAPSSHTMTIQATSSGSQSAGASVDVIQRETLTSGLTLVTSVAYLDNLKRFFIAEQRILSAPQGGAGGRIAAVAETATVSEQSPDGTLTPFVTIYDKISKIVPFTDANKRSYLLLAGENSGSIFRLDVSTRESKTVVTGLQGPKSMALDTITGNLLVSESISGRITTIQRTQFDPTEAAAAARLAAAGLAPGAEPKELVLPNPSGIGFDSCTGAVYISLADGTVREYLGNVERIVASGLDHPTQILVLQRDGVTPCQAGTTLLVCEAHRVAQIFPDSGRVNTFIEAVNIPRDLAFLAFGNPFVEGGESAIAVADDSVTIGGSRVLSIPIGALYGRNPDRAVTPVPLSGAGLPFQDPLGDVFESQASAGRGLISPDLVSVDAHGIGSSVILTLTFARPVAPYATGFPNALSGYIEFDTTPGVGIASRSNNYSQVGEGSGLGVDSWIDLSTGLLHLVSGRQSGAESGEQKADTTVPLDIYFLNDIVAVKVPARYVDITRARTVVIVGNLAEITDLGPNQRFIGMNTDTGGTPKVEFEKSTSKALESAGPIDLRVRLSSPAAGQVTVRYAASGGSAVQGTDFNLASGTLTFQPGETARGVTLRLVDNTTRQPDRTVIVSLSSPTGAEAGTRMDHTFTIVDDEKDPTVSFASATAGAPASAGTGSVGVRLSNPSAYPVQVRVRAVGGTARIGTDYSIGNANVNFEPGQTGGTFQFAILNDHAPGGDRTLSLGFEYVFNASPGAPSTMTFTITEVDIVTQVGFVAPSSIGYSGYNPMRVPVQLSGTWPNEVTVQYDVTGGTAIIGDDFTWDPGVLTFPANSTAPQYIDIYPVEPQPGRTIVLGLSNPTGGCVLGTNPSHTVTLAESPMLDFVPFQGVVTNAAQTVTVTVVLSQAMPIPIQASIAPEIYSGAQAGVDYVAFPLPVVLTFAPGQTSRSFDIQVLQNPARVSAVDLMLMIQYTESLPAIPGAFAFYYLTFQPTLQP